MTILDAAWRARRWVLESAAELEANIIGIAYDPGYDDAARLRAFGQLRGVPLESRTKLMRTTCPFAPLCSLFKLDVGYGPATVNLHRLDPLRRFGVVATRPLVEVRREGGFL